MKMKTPVVNSAVLARQTGTNLEVCKHIAALQADVEELLKEHDALTTRVEKLEAKLGKDA
jgi:cell division protein FtsB